MIVTIDGPAASGKSTIARELARHLGIAYLDTGATYRAVTLKAIRAGIELDDENSLVRLAKAAEVKLIPEGDGVRVLLDGADVSREIRSAEVSAASRYAAGSRGVREILVGLQRRLGAELGDFVAEGRDQGSVVFPEADVKFYLTASMDVRARRRCLEMQAAGETADRKDVLGALNERDRRDSSRAVGPLSVPAGAIEVDSSDKTVEQVRDELSRHVEAVR